MEKVETLMVNKRNMGNIPLKLDIRTNTSNSEKAISTSTIHVSANDFFDSDLTA